VWKLRVSGLVLIEVRRFGLFVGREESEGLEVVEVDGLAPVYFWRLTCLYEV